MTHVLQQLIAPIMIAMMVAASLFAVGLAVAQPAYAQSPAELACRGAGGTPVTGANGDVTCTSDDNINLIEGENSVFESVVNILSFIAGAVAVIMLLIGGIRYVISNGDANAVGSAKNTILYAIIGLVVVFAARAIILFVVDNIG